MKSTLQPAYTKLPEIYDAVMEDVDYVVWADFIDEVIQRHHPDPQTVLEMACGTGSLSLALNRYRCYDIMGTDKSPGMIQKAREKAARRNASVPFQVMDFLDINLNKTFDIIVSVFDSINYLRSKEDIQQLLKQTRNIMHKWSLFIFDFTTPRNSKQAIKYLDNDERVTENNYHYFRKSIYDAGRQIHYNVFEIEELADDRQEVIHRYTEEHRQRIYSLTQMQEIIEETDFEIVAAYSEFDIKKATSKSLRVTMVLRCPDMQ